MTITAVIFFLYNSDTNYSNDSWCNRKQKLKQTPQIIKLYKNSMDVFPCSSAYCIHWSNKLKDIIKTFMSWFNGKKLC